MERGVEDNSWYANMAKEELEQRIRRENMEWEYWQKIEDLDWEF